MQLLLDELIVRFTVDENFGFESEYSKTAFAWQALAGCSLSCSLSISDFISRVRLA